MMPTGKTGFVGWSERKCSVISDLAIFLGEAVDSFTAQLMALIHFADPGSLRQLELGFPREVTAWRVWCKFASPPSFLELHQALTEHYWPAPGHYQEPGT